MAFLFSFHCDSPDQGSAKSRSGKLVCRGQRTLAKQSRISLACSAGCSQAAKWPPRSRMLQWIRFGIHRSTQRREGRLVSRGYMLTPTGSSSLVDATLASLVGATLATLSQYSRAEEVALPGSQ